MSTIMRAAACLSVIACGLVLVAPRATVAQGTPAPLPPVRTAQTVEPTAAVAAILDEASQLDTALKFDDARARADEAIALAERTGDRIGLALGQRLQGQIFNDSGRAAAAKSWLIRARAGFEALGDRQGAASAVLGLIRAAQFEGDQADARALGAEALQIFDAIGDERGRARTLLLLLQGSPTRADDPRLTEILAVADRIGDDSLRAGALKARAAVRFADGDLTGAETSLEAAIAIFERLGDIEGAAASHLMIGRVHRAHGDYEGALREYQRAVNLLATTQDRYTLVEAVNATATALGFLDRNHEAVEAYERGLALARESGNERLIDFMLGNLGGGLAEVGDLERAIAVFREVLSRHPEPYIAMFRHNQLSVVLGRLGRWTEALESANESLRLSRELKLTDNLERRLDNRSSILMELGRLNEALIDSREALDVIHRVRSTLLPSDFLKRGYADSTAHEYARIIEILSRLGRNEEALEMSEQGRARAFLDLLAGRERTSALTTPSTESSGAAGPASLSSAASATPLLSAGIAAVARRLDSVVLAYWVGDEATVAWAVGPDGQTFSTRVPVTRARLAQLVMATTAPLRRKDDRRAVSTTTRGMETTAGEGDLTSLPLRGLGLLALERDDRSAWRELYKILVEPLHAHLPALGKRLTVVPHGPLFQLSFGALQTSGGRYLVEDYDLHYAPSVSTLDFTGRRLEAVRAEAPGPWLLVGNPRSLPNVDGRPLPPLPGAEREIDEIAALAPGQRARRLEGAAADQASLGRTLITERPSVVHFATHGFVFDDPKIQPFLALNRTGAAAPDDERLTLDEVYDLQLASDLVVLSACRTGTGPVSSDGVVGLTRAFFYSGAPSVMATFWDVTDEPTMMLMKSFYRRYADRGQKSASLRAAQLSLIADLRAGRVAVMASGRRVTLPEHPLLWAAFFLSGEP